MLRVTVELVPFGIEKNTEIIGEMVIGNENTYADNTANYVYAYRDNSGIEEFGYVSGFDRTDGIWRLMHRCLEEGNMRYEEFEDLLRSKFRSGVWNE